MSEMVDRLSVIIARGQPPRETAIAILEAMREPTRPMLMGGVTLEPTRSAEIVRFLYQGMIDAALK